MKPDEVQIVLDSVSPAGLRLTTARMRIPKFVLGELARHRTLSLSAGSTRAKPTRLFIREVIREPYVPLEWGHNRKGMQAGKAMGTKRAWLCRHLWLLARWPVILAALGLVKLGLAKQWAGRILEPWSFVDVVITATRWDNLLALRCHADAQPEFRKVAVRLGRLLRDSTPVVLDWGRWHLPFISPNEAEALKGDLLLKMSTARCGRVSVCGFDGQPKPYSEDERLHDQFVAAWPKHLSPTEHQGYFATDHVLGRGGNLGPGVVQYRKTIQGEVVEAFDDATLDQFPDD